MDPDRGLLRAAALLGFVAVAAGAFGAHALAERVTPERLANFETGTRYLLAHAPVLVLLALLPERFDPWRRRGFLLMATGAGVFAGSLALLVLLDRPFFGAITPVGGLLLLAGWLSLLGLTRRD